MAHLPGEKDTIQAVQDGLLEQLQRRALVDLWCRELGRQYPLHELALKNVLKAWRLIGRVLG